MGYIKSYKKWVLTESEEAINPVASKLATFGTIKKGSNDTKAVSLLQTMLVKTGFLKGKQGPLKNGVDADFGGATETALNNFIGKTFFTPDDATIVSNKLNTINVNSQDIFDTWKNYDVARLKSMNLSGDQGILQDYYSKFYSKKGGFPTPSGSLKDDIYAYIYFKEGGMTDDPDDSGPASDPMPFYYNSESKKIYNPSSKKWEQLSGELLPAKTKAFQPDDSKYPYRSNKWHTNRGITWSAWKSKGSGSDFDKAKKWLTVDREEVAQKYLNDYYNPAVASYGTTSELANHFLGLVRWGGGPGGLNSYMKNYIGPALKKLGLKDLNDALSKKGERWTLDMMVKYRLDHLYNISQLPDKGKYLKGWSNSKLNFHQVFVNYYAKGDIASPDKSTDDEYSVSGNTVVKTSDEYGSYIELPEIVVSAPAKSEERPPSKI